MLKPTLLLTFAVLFAIAAPAQVQVPDTPAGRLYVRTGHIGNRTFLRHR